MSTLYGLVAGLGQALLSYVYEQARKRESVFEVTVEDPAPSFEKVGRSIGCGCPALVLAVYSTTRFSSRCWHLLFVHVTAARDVAARAKRVRWLKRPFVSFDTSYLHWHRDASNRSLWSKLYAV